MCPIEAKVVNVADFFRGHRDALAISEDRTANFSAISRAVMTDSERALARNYLQGVVQLGCKTTRS